jgi:hypothetical protein
MTQNKIEVTPETKVHDLLEAYPELEDALISIAPPFKKLKNPFLRKTVAKVATVKHISSVGNVPLNELLNKIRTSIGQEAKNDSYSDENYFLSQPEWFSTDKIALSITEDKVEEKDKMTLVIILEKAREVQKGQVIELITSFLPAPGIDILKSKGYSVWTKKESDDVIKSYFLKNA